MNLTNAPTYGDDPVLGQPPAVFFGVDAAPDGDAEPFLSAPLGSLFISRSVDDVSVPVHHWLKVKDDGADNDWSGYQCIAQTVALADFTDGGAAVGTVVLDQAIPAGALVVQTIIQDVTGFAGNTSAVLTVGDGTDVDRYNTGTPSVFATAKMVAAGVPSGTTIHTTAKNVTLTVTSASDFTSVSAGQLTVKIWYLI